MQQPPVGQLDSGGRSSACADPPPPGRVRDLLAKAREARGLDLAEAAALMHVESPELLEELYATAREVKQRIYGSRLVFFAPLYVSNLCSNECLYCAFRASSRSLPRRQLSADEVAEEARLLVRQGHKRVLLVAGEAAGNSALDHVLQSVQAIYSVSDGPGRIRRVNVNVAPLSVDGFRRLKQAGIGTYQLFQETYHRPTYRRVHPSGPKADFDWRLEGPARAMTAGIDDVGLGVLLGLSDWRGELLSLLGHVHELEARFGIGPHTISVPRIEPAAGAELANSPPCPVSDAAFLRIVAVLRLAVPYTGIIMSTRESPDVRRATFQLGVSQISAGSRTSVGGYVGDDSEAGQFSLGDHRSLDEVVRDVATMGYVPSFCAACYRLGRTGEHFMELARPGDIRERCSPNALSTFLEYLLDYASEPTRRVGERLIARELSAMADGQRAGAERMLSAVRAGRRDVFV